MFSRELIDYTVSTFKESKIDILTGTMVKEVKEKTVVLQMPDKTIKEVPVGMVVWAGGNKARGVTIDLMSRLADAQKNKRGITVDGEAVSLLCRLLSDSVDSSKIIFVWRAQTAPSLPWVTAPPHSTHQRHKSPRNRGPTLHVCLNSSRSVMLCWSRLWLCRKRGGVLRA